MSVAAARPASTVVLLRPANPFDVFLVRRSDSIAFMGGAHVFPGGGVDDEDRLDDIDALSDGSAEAAALMSDVPREVALAHHVAALRELFEEAGVLLARQVPTQQLERYRRDLLAGQTTFGDIVRGERLRLAFDELAYFAHWVTPEIETRRFDTRFFIARSPEGQTPVHDEGETSHSEWFAPLAAIERCRSGVISLPPPTWTTLSMLSRFGSIDEVFGWARRKPIPRVQPRFEKRGDQTLLFYPGDPMYPAVEGFDAAETRFVLENRRWRPVRPD
ncbi:MAG: NUDIX hydrolase [Acidobacteria bacterium]|nr:MAG: NUDIX hydrolase [Acidobacteriota bacterium]